jgi:hypothetical protein
MSLVVIYSVGQEAAADTYLSFCNLNCPEHATDPNAIWYRNNIVDAYGQRVVAYLGPGGRGDITEEPEGGEEARGIGVLQEGFDPPPEEEF